MGSPHRSSFVAPLLSSLLLAPATAQEPIQGLTPAAKQASHQRMVKELAAIAERAKTDHKYHGDQNAKRLWAELAAQGDKAPWKLRLDASLEHLRLGVFRAQQLSVSARRSHAMPR